MIRLWHEQNVQVKSERFLGVPRGNPQHSRAQAAKSAAQAQRSRPIRGTCSPAGHRQRQTSAILKTFMPRIRRFMKAYAILGQKLYALFGTNRPILAQGAI